MDRAGSQLKSNPVKAEIKSIDEVVWEIQAGV